MTAERIILFDGVCNFCNASVQFIIERDPKAQFHFASLQSDVGQGLLRDHNIPLDVQSIVLIENGQAFRKSTAALRIARRLSRGWPLLAAFMIIPPFIRNAVYDFIARNRYKWFGKQDSCMLPAPELASRFLG